MRSPLDALAFILLLASSANTSEIRFSRDIRPILSDKCFACHGPDTENAATELRLDLAEAASDYGAIVPGEPNESELVSRILSDDEGSLMPPPDAHKPLTAQERELLIKWISQGAVYEPHWAYAAVQPAPDNLSTNLVDHFVSQQLADSGIDPVDLADRVTIVRRLSLDLTGLPPTLKEVDAFVNDPSRDAYRNLIDRLLNSPRYGERMTSYWLDLVRYADTVGYHGDQNVSQWAYRDYVINAFNSNLPYDQFIREQIAGDLLPEATIQQKVASGYNRLNQTTEEGGAQAKEYLAIYFADRVRNVSQVFLGSTLGCAQCHDHKFDPFTTKDFYALGAFFADLEERGVYGGNGTRAPVIALPSDKQREEVSRLKAVIATAESEQAKLREQCLSHLDDSMPQAGIDANSIPEDVKAAWEISKQDRTDEQTKLLQDYVLQSTESVVKAGQKTKQLKADLKRIEQSIPTTVVSKSVKPRTIRVLPRGNWMDDSGEIVEPAIPEFLGTIVSNGRRATRLDLANWLSQPDNPLTARTMVNRLWSLMFGRGICASVDDFGGQGAYPSNPDLLDALANEFVVSGWDIKHIMRLIAESKTYQRSSRPTPALRQTDPYNDYFARQGRFRLDAEFVRDSALAISGLLTEKVGGPSVRPYQPADYYAQLNFPKRKYQADTGENQYRRGVYTHWQRTFLHPMLKAFDAPSREECTAKRARSSTPLQSLVLLNDPTFVEAARVFATRVLREPNDSPRDRTVWAYRVAIAHQPEDEIVAGLVDLLQNHQKQFREDPNSAKQLVAIGQTAVPGDLDVVELAAWTSVARAILNLHEAIMRY